MRGHAYHPSCGCYACCQSERAAERDQELTALYAADLRLSPSLIGEVCLSDEETIQAAEKLRECDSAGFALVWRVAIDRYVTESIAERAEERGCEPSEAARSLCEVYGVPARAAA